MARHRRKTRTHVAPSEEAVSLTPRSMVLSVGDALKNHSVTQLVSDMRNVMQPHTAINLKERKSNKLKDFVVMAGPLGVSHMLVFSQSESGTVTLRLTRLPRGPTLVFRVKNYSLCKDVRRILKHPKSQGKESKEYLNPPLLVLNGFTSPAKAEPHEKVMITLLQSMFPPISPQATKVSSIRRVLILNKNSDGDIDLRHYAIDTKPVEISKSIKKLVAVKEKAHKKLPNLAKVSDVADFVLDPYSNGAGFTSESEIEDDEIVRINENSPHASNKHGKQHHKAEEQKPVTESAETRKKAVKLTEIGPRIKLDLIKIEEDVCSGKVLYHSYVQKSQAEIQKLEQRHAVRRKLRLQRQKEQNANVEAKKEKKEAKKLRRKAREEERKNNGLSAGSDNSQSDSESEVEDQDDKLFSDEE